MILKKINRDFLIIFIGKLLQVLLLIVAIRISTALLNPEEMGNIYLFTTIYTFFVLSFISPAGQYFNRHTHKWHIEKSILDKMAMYFIYLLLISLLSIVVSYQIYNLGISQNIDMMYFIILVFLFILFLTLNQTFLPLLNMLEYRLSFTVLTILTALGVIVFGYLFVVNLGNFAENWLLGIVLSNSLFALIGFFILKNRLSERFNGFIYNFKQLTKEKIRYILSFMIPLAVATLFMWLQNSGYRILIEQNISLEFLGYLGVGMAVSAQIATTIESIAMQYFHPLYYKEITNSSLNDRKKAIEVLINRVLPIYFLLAIFLSFLAKYVVFILVDEKYHHTYIFTIFGIWIEFFRMTTNLFGNISQSEMNTKRFMMPYIFGSIITIILVYFTSLTQSYKILLPLTLIFGGFITMIIMYISMKKLINFRINFNLIILSLLFSIPYVSLLFIDFKSNFLTNIIILFIFGVYFLFTIFIISKKGLLNGNR